MHFTNQSINQKCIISQFQETGEVERFEVFTDFIKVRISATGIENGIF